MLHEGNAEFRKENERANESGGKVHYHPIKAAAHSTLLCETVLVKWPFVLGKELRREQGGHPLRMSKRYKNFHTLW